MTEKMMLYIVIVGCGRLGSYLANKLSRSGHSIVVIDNNPATHDLLSSEFSGFWIDGDATEFAVLKNAKIDKADALIATTREDNLNIMVAQVAKKMFGVPRVVARVFDPAREEIYREFGIETISPTAIASEFFLDSVASQSFPAGRGGR